MSDQFTIPAKLPGPSEIVGLIAGAVPFMIHTSSSSTTTVNGEVVSAVYRDWTAVGGGAVAVVCGLISFLLLGRTDNKPLRLGLAVGLLALGGYQVARGFGVV